MNDSRNNTIGFLIEQKVSFVNSVVNVCMLWWASSIVFCASVLAAVWSHQEQLRQNAGFVKGLGIVLFVFFFVIAVFGFLVGASLGKVQREIAALAKEITNETPVSGTERFFLTEIRTFQYSMWLGAGSFAIIHTVWTLFWLYLSAKPICSYICGGVVEIAAWIMLAGVFLFLEKQRSSQ